MENRQLLAMFIVNTTNDSGNGSLRKAISDSNLAPGTIAQPNVIDFEIGANIETIEPNSPLPAITAPVSIDTTLSSFGSQQEVEIRGDLAGPGVDGLTIAAGGSGSTIKGLVIDSFGGSGILVHGGGDNLIAFNFIGTDPAGLEAMPNGGDGVTIEGSSGNTIGGSGVDTYNLISGNLGAGIAIEGGSSSNLIERNKIGLDNSFEAALPNGGDGLEVLGSTGDTIGGAVAGQANLISGNTGSGISLGSGSSRETLLANEIGVDAFGTRAIPNGGDGLTIEASPGDTIGGTAFTLGNVISGNSGNGITIGPGSSPLVLQGNLIGTDPTGSTAIANGGDGIAIQGASAITIGGTVAGSANVISGNTGAGVSIVGLSGGSLLNDVIEGNHIGTDVTGFASLANRGSGVLVSGVQGILVGGPSTLDRNLINGDTFTDTGVIQDASQVAIVGPGASGNLVEGNYIGLTASGFAFVGRSGATGLSTTSKFNTGVLIQDAPANTIDGNVISGAGDGVMIEGAGSSGNLLEANFIGVDASGLLPQGNAFDGIDIVGASDNTIGGTTAGSANVVSANGNFNIAVETSSAPNSPVASGNLIEENLIGPTSTQSIGLGISLGGVLLSDSINDQVINNIISGNGGPGLQIAGSSSILVRGNLVGTDASGISRLLGNKFEGVDLSNASNNTIGGTIPGQGNIISGNSGNGLEIDSAASTGNLILGNRIGTDASGTHPAANSGDGVLLYKTTGNTIGGTAPLDTNVISGNTLNGVEIAGGSGNLVSGNLIGTDDIGMNAVPNARDGVFINGASNNTIGGTATATLNVISGNTLDGVGIAGAGATRNVVLGDIIGTNLGYLASEFTFTGANSLVNRGDGVRIDGFDGDVSGNTIGGTAAGSENVIAGNLANGVEIDNPMAMFEVVIGNNIGNVSGVDPVTGVPLRQPNFQNGVAIVNSSSNQIGGPTPAERNIISGNNQDGIEILGGNLNVVEGNYVGSDAAGMIDEGNLGDGIAIHTGTVNTIGGTSEGDGNLILGNGGSGISITQSLGNDVEGNQIGLNLAGSLYSGTLNADGSPHELGNNEDGILLNNDSVGNLIGGSVAGARNVISGNLKNGISVINASLSNVIQGNDVGLDPSGLIGEGNRLNGIYITTSYNLVGGTDPGSANVISGNLNSGVVLSTSSAIENLIVGNLIGTNVLGGVNPDGSLPNLGADSQPIGNRQDGIFVNDDAVLNTIGGGTASARNVISGNGSDGIQIFSINVNPSLGAPTGDYVLGNFIGTTATGFGIDGNASAGIDLYNAEGDIVGAVAGGQNVISGNLGAGVSIHGDASTNNLVEANFIGTDPTSTFLIGNRGDGVALVEAEDNQIGGPDPGDGNVVFDNGGSGISLANFSDSAEIEGNVISSNSGNGVLVANQSASDVVTGNMIGVDASGEIAEGNSLAGVRIDNAAFGTLVFANVISANQGSGVVVTGVFSGATIQGNTIGLDALGEIKLGNAVGVEIDGVPDVTVGGPGLAGNFISGNNVGVLVNPAADTSFALNDQIQGNIIGLDKSGANAVGNTFGIFLDDAVGVTIGGVFGTSGNVISGNTGVGVQAFRVSSGGSGNTIEGNIIGLDPSGRVVPYGAVQPIGVFLNESSNNTVGGTVTSAMNVISGNTTDDANTPSFGVSIFGQSDAQPLDNVVEGNIIGLTLNGGFVPTAGTTSVQTVGVAINASSGNTVGGTTEPTRNMIGGNVVGVQVAGQVAKFGNSPIGNLIEDDTVDFNTFGVFLNGASGNTVTLDNLSDNTSIGLAIVGSLASGNLATYNQFIANGSAASGATAGSTVGVGVYIEAAMGNTIEHNTIRNTGLRGNSSDGVGVYIFDNASGNLVARNTIGGSSAYGILVYNSASNLSSIPRTGTAQNSISSSGIASFREFTGSLKTTTKKVTGKSTPKGPKVKKQSVASTRVNHR